MALAFLVTNLAHARSCRLNVVDEFHTPQGMVDMPSSALDLLREKGYQAEFVDRFLPVRGASLRLELRSKCFINGFGMTLCSTRALMTNATDSVVAQAEAQTPSWMINQIPFGSVLRQLPDCQQLR